MLKILRFYPQVDVVRTKGQHNFTLFFQSTTQKTVKSLIYLRTYRNLVDLSKKILDGIRMMSII